MTQENPRRGARCILPILLVACLLPLAARSQDLTGAVGVTRGGDATDRTLGLSLSYSHDLARHLSASFSYLNEGHVPGHRRDGFTPQLWAHSGHWFGPRLSLAAGAGPYYYFDTVEADSAAGYADRNGWGIVYSLAATLRAASSPWLYQLRFNRVVLRDGMDTSMLLAAIGYRLDQDEKAPARAGTQDGDLAPRNELTLLSGLTIVNSLDSQQAWAKGFEYRRAFGRVVHGSVTLLDEGDGRVTQRRGVAAQAWLEPSFYDHKLTLGAGLGPYIAVDDYREDRDRALSGIVSLTASYRFTHAWAGRLTFSRVVSRYDRDTDLILFGLGYRF